MNAEGLCYQDPMGQVLQIEAAKIRLSRMPESTFHTHRLSALNPRPEVEGLESAIQTVRKLVDGEMAKPLVLLYSATPGLGKTHLAYAAGWMMLGKGKSVSFYKVADLLDELRSGYRVSENYRPDQQAGGTMWTYEQIMRRIQTVHFLILDDIGLQKMSEWSVEKLDQIVDYRYDNDKATLLTSNGLEFSHRIVSRCKEGALVRLKGPDYRGIEMIITLACHPPKECSPNARVHWSVKAKAARAFRQTVRLEAEIQTPNDWNVPERAGVKLTIVCAEERIRDADNWLSRFKPGMDGLVDAEVIRADDINHLTVTAVAFVVDAELSPKTIIEIEAAK